MFAIEYKGDGAPICCQVPGVSPDPVVVWSSRDVAQTFIDSTGGGADYEVVEVNEKAMEAMATALGCSVESLMLEPYPS